MSHEAAHRPARWKRTWFAVTATPTCTSTSWPVECLVTISQGLRWGGRPLVLGSDLLHLHPEGQAVLDLEAAHGCVAEGGENGHELLDT